MGFTQDVDLSIIGPFLTCLKKRQQVSKQPAARLAPHGPRKDLPYVQNAGQT
jgi:hypothetical protein